MQVITSTVAATAKQLPDIKAKIAIIQAPATNSGTLYWGDKYHQLNETTAGKHMMICVSSLDEIWFKGTADDVIAVTILD